MRSKSIKHRICISYTSCLKGVAGCIKFVLKFTSKVFSSYITFIMSVLWRSQYQKPFNYLIPQRDHSLLWYFIISLKYLVEFDNVKKTIKIHFSMIPAGIYLLEVNNRNTRIRYEICSKLTIERSERRQWHRSSVFFVDFE